MTTIPKIIIHIKAKKRKKKNTISTANQNNTENIHPHAFLFYIQLHTFKNEKTRKNTFISLQKTKFFFGRFQIRLFVFKSFFFLINSQVKDP